MNAKEYLRQLGRAEENIKAKEQRLAILHDIATSPSAPVLSDMPKAPNRNTSKFEDMIIKMLTLEDEIRRDEKNLREEQTYALELIGRIENPEYQTVLISRYFRKESWEDIAAAMFYTERWIYKLHGRALQAMDDVLEQFR